MENMTQLHSFYVLYVIVTTPFFSFFTEKNKVIT